LNSLIIPVEPKEFIQNLHRLLTQKITEKENKEHEDPERKRQKDEDPGLSKEHSEFFDYEADLGEDLYQDSETENPTKRPFFYHDSAEESEEEFFPIIEEKSFKSNSEFKTNELGKNKEEHELTTHKMKDSEEYLSKRFTKKAHKVEEPIEKTKPTSHKQKPQTSPYAGK
jgi:hypothetical protein